MMNRKQVIAILDDPPIMSPPGVARNTQVQGLLDLAEQIQGILVPVAPNDRFRQQLRSELLLEATRRPQKAAAPCQARPSQVGLTTKPGVSLFQQHRKGILIGAAAVGSAASVMGVIIAFVLHYRHGRATPLRPAAG